LLVKRILTKIGSDLVKWFTKNYGFTEFMSVYLGNELLKTGIYTPCVEGEPFLNSDSLYVVVPYNDIQKTVDGFFQPKTRKKSASFSTTVSTNKRASLFNITFGSSRKTINRMSVDLSKSSSTKEVNAKKPSKSGLKDFFSSIKKSASMFMSPKKPTKVYGVKISGKFQMKLTN
jgi:hypothetical protein